MVGKLDFDDFMGQEYEGVVRALTLVFNDRDLAEDCAQDAFEKALIRWRRVSAMDRPGTWVYVVAVRRGRRQLERIGRAVGVTPMDDRLLEQDAVVDAMWVQQLLTTLPLRQRAVVVLRHAGGLPLADIAAALGISVGTVKSTLHAAYRNLRVEVAEQEEGVPDAR